MAANINNNSTQTLSPINRLIQEKALYTKADRRRNLFDNSINEIVKGKALSVACLIEQSIWTKEGDRYRLTPQTLHERVEKIEKAALGPDEAFRNEPSLGNGTAFLVGPQLALTAAHCVCNKDINEIMSVDKVKQSVRLIFGFQMTAATEWQSEVHEDKVYSIKKVVQHSFKQDQGDWALLKLDRPVKDIPYLELDFINEVIDDQEIYMLGHPYGLPIKFTEGLSMPNQAQHSQEAAHTFQAEIDAFAGNSGSPVFNKATHKVVGMLIRGKKDWEMNQEGAVIARHITQEEIKQAGYEKCQKMSSLPMDIIRKIDPSQIGKQTVIDKLWNQVLSLFAQNKTMEAIKCFEEVAQVGLSCRYYEVAAFIQDKYPALASKIATDYLERARNSGFVPANPDLNLNIKNTKVQMSENADMTNITDKDGKINNERATISGDSILANLSGGSGSSSNVDLSMRGSSRALNVANHPEGTALALEQLKQKLGSRKK